MDHLSPTTAKLISSGAVVLTLFVVRWLALRVIHRYIEEASVWYRARKIATYITTGIVVVTLAFIWIDAFDNFSTYLGLVSAGVAIALSDLLKNMAGWAYILVRRPFRVGDRIEVDGTRGDIIDIRLFRFTLMEIGNWVHADQSTGRIVHIPNGIMFTNKVANYTEGFEYIWHEVPVLVTFESDWERAERIVFGAIQHASTEIVARATRSMRDTARQYQLKVGTLTPITYVTVQDSGVLVTGRFLVEARGRRGAEQRVWKEILRAFASEPDVDLAYPTVRTYFEGPVELSGPGSVPAVDPTAP